MKISINNYKVEEKDKENTFMVDIIELIQNISLNRRNLADEKWTKEVKVGAGNTCSILPAGFFAFILDELKREQKKAGKFRLATVCKKVKKKHYPYLEDATVDKISSDIRAYLHSLEIIKPVNKAIVYRITDMDRIDKLIKNPFIAETKEWTA